jgi:hypothetical protein
LLACLFTCLLACLLTCLLACLLTYLLACLLIYLFTCLLAYLLACLLACLLTCLLTYLFTCLLACLLTYLLACLPAYLLACLLACLLAYLLTYLLTLSYLLTLTYLLTHSLTHSMQHSPSCEANRFSASQEILRILWKPKVHYRSHKCHILSSKRFRVHNNTRNATEQEVCSPAFESDTLTRRRENRYNRKCSPSWSECLQRLESSALCGVYSSTCKVARFTSYLGQQFSFRIVCFPSAVVDSKCGSVAKQANTPSSTLLSASFFPHCNATNYEKFPTLNIAAPGLFLCLITSAIKSSFLIR